MQVGLDIVTATMLDAPSVTANFGITGNAGQRGFPALAFGDL